MSRQRPEDEETRWNRVNDRQQRRSGPMRSGQFSLRRFLIITALVGVLCGAAGPVVVRFLSQWQPRSRQAARPAPPPAVFDYEPASAYYESAETPLD